MKLDLIPPISTFHILLQEYSVVTPIILSSCLIEAYIGPSDVPIPSFINMLLKHRKMFLKHPFMVMIYNMTILTVLSQYIGTRKMTVEMNKKIQGEWNQLQSVLE